jgi:8-oxo-dGTP pyrophosphatase MutT (NUDIX family)
VSIAPSWLYLAERHLGRFVTRLAAILTLERMPPFVSTSVIVVVRDRVLVVIDPIRREPILPGGHLTWRESPEAAAVREVQEETGYTVETGTILGVFAGEEWAGEPGIVRIIFEATITSGSLQSSSEGETRWMPVADLLASSTRDAPVIRVWRNQRRVGFSP